MAYRNINAKGITGNSKNAIYTGCLAGGAIGAMLGFILSFGVLPIPGMNLISTTNPVYFAIAGAILGAIAGVLIRSLYRLRIPQEKLLGGNSYLNEASIELRGEELELFKHRVQTGQVKIRKEILKEEKNITVPVTREELVIEKSGSSKEGAGNTNGGIETIRIPIREESIEIIKHPVMLEDVSVYKHQIQGLQHIEGMLRREKLRVKTSGDVNVIEKGIEE